MIAFRPALPDDAETLVLLARETFAETFGHLYRAEDLAAFLATHTVEGWRAELADPTYRVRIGEADGKAVAYAKLGPPKLPVVPRGPSAELRQFYVLAPWHGSGAAQTMMGWVIDTARQSGAADLYLSVFVDNHRAKRFYTRLGFERIGTYAFAVGNHQDEDDVMRLAL